MQTQLRSMATAILLCFACLPEAAYAQTNTATGVEALQSNTTGINNTATGYRALRFNTSGFFNTATGAAALLSNTTGFRNTASGATALSSNTTGSNNTASGYGALASNTTGSSNTASGLNALRSNTTGNRNTANGIDALSFNTTGEFNTASGWSALFFNTTGGANTAIGIEALRANTTGSFNTANGYEALASNTTGSNNTASGREALFTNTTGSFNTANGYWALVANTTGILNTAAGSNALRSNTTGQENTASGIYASYHSTTGYFNTSSGAYALFANDAGARNTASGATALAALTTGLDNTGLGTGAGFSFNHSQSTFIGSTCNATRAVNNSTALGYGAIVTGDNQVRIGNTAVSSIGGQVNWTTFSDGRFKKNLNEDVPGLAFITKLRPVTYSLDVDGIAKKLNVEKPTLSVEGTGDGSKLTESQKPSPEEKKARDEKAKVVYTGFVAQEVEEAAKSLNYDFSGVDKPKNKEDFYGLKYGDFVVPLVKAVQELSAENKELKEDNRQLREEMNELKSIVTKLVNGQEVKANKTTATISGAYLKQNVPNPHSGTTVIQYYLPQGTTSAQVVVTNSKGQVLKTIALNSRGEGQVSLQAGALPSGTYMYSLWIEGRQADAKQMIIAK